MAAVRRIAAMLDLDADRLRTGDALPRGWHFILLGADTKKAALRPDGFPGLGVPLPDLGLPRVMLGARTVAFDGDVPIGADMERTSNVSSVRQKGTGTDRMVIVTINHQLRLSGQTKPSITETQTYLLLPGSKTGPMQPPPSAAVTAERTRIAVPDETLLFQYSALGFNSHKIHLDRAHAREVEGFPDLVVNGGLATLLLTEFLREDLGFTPAALRVRHMAPLYCGRPLRLTADRKGSAWHLRAFDDKNTHSIDMEVEIQ